MIVMAILWRAYFAGMAVLLLNSLAILIFAKPSLKNLKRFFVSLPFILIWPLSALYERGRRLMTKRIDKF